MPATYDFSVPSRLIEVTIGEIVGWSLLIGVTAWVAFMIYRAMDHPRLVLTATPDGLRAMPRDVVQYAVSMPILIALWWMFFWLVFLLSENHLGLLQLFVFPSALIVSIRAFAFLSPVTARELGKIIPVALVAFIILEGKIRSLQEIEEFIQELDLLNIDFWAILFVLMVDYLFTLIWYWGWIRWAGPLWQRRVQARSVQEVAHHDGGVSVLPDADGADRGA